MVKISDGSFTFLAPLHLMDIELLSHDNLGLSQIIGEPIAIHCIATDGHMVVLLNRLANANAVAHFPLVNKLSQKTCFL